MPEIIPTRIQTQSKTVKTVYMRGKKDGKPEAYDKISHRSAFKTGGVLCDTARRFQSNITFRRGNNISNAKSLLSVLGAGVRYGDEIEIICEGEDEQEALETVLL